MASIQANLLNLYLRVQRVISPPVKKLDVVKERARFNSFSNMFKPLTELKFESVDINGVPGEWITPPLVNTGRMILYLHGGFFMIGSIQSHRNLAGNIANSAQARALIIEYRLAPEHPFPAGLEDAVSAYIWLLEHVSSPNKIILAGDSAGGGLVLSTLLALRERGKPMPGAAICLSPATDLTFSGESWKFNANKELVIGRYIAEQIQPLYLVNIDPHNPLASPLFADLHGLPPLLIQVGSDEVLLSDSESFSDCARKAGVEVTLEVWPYMQHVWQYTASFMPEARQAIEKMGAFVKTVSQNSGSET